MDTYSDSGRIWLDNGVIHYEAPSGELWSLSASELKVVGEYTTDNGPFVDDYYLVFITSAEEGWYELSMYANGITEFLVQLAELLDGADLTSQLANSAVFASRILWPLSSRGKQLFAFTPA